MLKVIRTSGIVHTMECYEKFAREIDSCIGKYWSANWGDTCASDSKMNDKALRNGHRIVALYKTSQGNVFIISDHGHVVTTVLFADEY